MFDSTDMASDPLSEMLSIMNARAFYEGSLRAGGLWSVRFPASDQVKLLLMARGSCWLAVDGDEQPRHMGLGDVFMLARARAFNLFTDYARRPVHGPGLFADGARSDAHLGRGHELLMVSGYVSLDALHLRAAGDVLPPTVHLPSVCKDAGPLRWLVEQLVEEQTIRANGFSATTTQIINQIFVHILRLQLERQDAIPTGWFRLLSDKLLIRAIRLIHDQPARNWSLTELARASGMSRTSFALRFKETGGLSPGQYQTRWRIRLAKKALRDGVLPMAELARSLGYTSESAFRRAFKRETERS